MELKPCPHCGGEAELTYNYNGGAGNFLIFAKCTFCGSQGKIYNSYNDPNDDNRAFSLAAKAWNMRIKEV